MRKFVFEYTDEYGEKHKHEKKIKLFDFFLLTVNILKKNLIMAKFYNYQLSKKELAERVQLMLILTK